MESIVSAVIRATGNCNLDCKYCYERDKAKINMSIDTLKNVIKKFIDYNEYHAHFSWIGGEPLLRHNSFFEKIIELQEKNNTKNIIIKNSIQTNGLLLSPERLNFLRNLGYKVGISYDGTDDLTDALRISKNGKRYGKDISDCIHSCPRDVGTITVLTKKSIGRAKEIYDNLKAKTKSASFNLFMPSSNVSENNELLPDPKEFGELLIELYTHWKNDDGDLMLHPFTSIIKSLTSGENSICEYSAKSCYQLVLIKSTGEVYTCSRSTHRKECYLGDINKQSLTQILANPARKKVLERMQKLQKECCEYFQICNGGCPQEALSTNGDEFSKTYYCKSKKKLFDYICEDIKK